MQVLESIASARELSIEQLQSVLKEAPLQPQRALELKLVDGILYRDEVDKRMLLRLKRAALWQRAEQRPLEWPDQHLGQSEGQSREQEEALVSASQQVSLPSPAAAGAGKPGEQQLLEQRPRGPTAGTASSAQEERQSEAKELRRRHKGPRVSLQRYWECMQYQQQLVQRQQAWQRWRRGGKDTGVRWGRRLCPAHGACLATHCGKEAWQAYFVPNTADSCDAHATVRHCTPMASAHAC